MEKEDYIDFYGIEEGFETQEISLEVTEEDYKAMTYQSVKTLDHYDERFSPVDEDGNALINIWYCFTEEHRTYYEYVYQPADGSPQAYLTCMYDPRAYEDFGTLRVDIEFITSSDRYSLNTGSDFRNYCDAKDTFVFYLDNMTSCCRYVLTVTSSCLSDASSSEGGYLYYDVLLPTGEYNISIADTPFDSIARTISARTLVRSDRSAFATVTIEDGKISGAWHKIGSVFSCFTLAFLSAALILHRFFRKERRHERITI